MPIYIYLPLESRDYLRFHLFTYVYRCFLVLPMFNTIYSLLFTYDCPSSLVFTYIYTIVPVYPSLLVFTYVCSCLPKFTCVSLF